MKIIRSISKIFRSAYKWVMLPPHIVQITIIILLMISSTIFYLILKGHISLLGSPLDVLIIPFLDITKDLNYYDYCVFCLTCVPGLFAVFTLFYSISESYNKNGQNNGEVVKRKDESTLSRYSNIERELESYLILLSGVLDNGLYYKADSVMEKIFATTAIFNEFKADSNIESFIIKEFEIQHAVLNQVEKRGSTRQDIMIFFGSIQRITHLFKYSQTLDILSDDYSDTS